MLGILALGIYTMGSLAKFYAEDIEHINKGPVEALRSSGASKRQIIAITVIPQIIPFFVANNLEKTVWNNYIVNCKYNCN